METAQATEYAVTLQTPGGMFRGNMRLRMDEHTAGGMLIWESYRIPFSDVPVRNGEAVFQGRLNNLPMGITVRVRLKDGGNILQGTVITPFGSFPAYGRRIKDISEPAASYLNHRDAANTCFPEKAERALPQNHRKNGSN